MKYLKGLKNKKRGREREKTEKIETEKVGQSRSII